MHEETGRFRRSDGLRGDMGICLAIHFARGSLVVGEMLTFLRIVKQDAAALLLGGQISSLHGPSVDTYLGQFTFSPNLGTWLRAWVEQYAGNALGWVSAARTLKLVSGAGGSIRRVGQGSADFLVPSTRSLTEALANDVGPALRMGVAVTPVRRQAEGSYWTQQTVRKRLKLSSWRYPGISSPQSI